MKKIYLVDSENVGDIWVPLLASSQPEDEVLVFYTQKSPHMNYENVRILKETDKEAVFIKCFEGSNALDFQLVTELGYRLHADADCTYVIVSNDTGFDAVVRYWAAKEHPVVSRLSGKECHRRLQEKKRQGDKKPNAPVWNEEPAYEQSEEIQPEHSQSMPMPEEQTEAAEQAAAIQQVVAVEQETATGQVLPSDGPIISGEEKALSSDGSIVPRDVAEQVATEPSDELSNTALEELPAEQAKVIEALCNCISKDNLVDFHNALVAFLGEDEGKALYQEIKGNAMYTVHWSSLPKIGQKEKFETYCRLVFDYSEPKEDEPEDFADFLYHSGGKRKNLNSLRAALQGHFGKDKGMRYYSLFKSHIKIMNRM